MTAFWSQFFDSSSYIPHGHCYLWQTGLVWLHITGDVLIALAYYSIPLTLLFFVRNRRDLPFNWIFLLFGAFIIACGTGHILDIWTLWHPDYWISGGVKAFTAMISVLTAVELYPLIPKALALPSPAQLTLANQSLQVQIGERRQAEIKLKRYQDQLEELVAQRTVELTQINAQLQQEIIERQRIQEERESLLRREQRAREQAEAANRVKDEFLAVLSHELRTPLNPILGWTKLLQKQQLKPEKAAIALDTIERNAKLQAQLIEDLLDISRIVRGKLTQNTTAIDLKTVVLAAIQTVSLAAEAKQIEIETTIEAEVGQLLGDAGRLQQVVWNLLSNAVKFTPEGGRVKVILTAEDSDQAKIIIRDTGKGITADALPFVFDRFWQEDSTNTRQFGGLGLGLAISRQIVELHGGTITAESVGEGQGATFTVRLPLRAPVPVPVPIRSSVSENSTLEGLRILVVDDSPDSREYAKFVLSEAGSEVTGVDSAEAALKALSQQLPDVIVCDIGLPEINGYELIRQIRARPIEQGGKIPAIALTSYAGDYDQRRAIAAGFQRHLSKPVEPEQLVKSISAICPFRMVEEASGLK
ncbi:MAG: response regulator [Phormidium tanganyikae FI6-MK23]|jgi:signal transduction histidine kinase/ActR/RegA family two-component response regulator|nr:response regulator [Phormidium tanganyikae FI6-MK23]